MLACLSFHPAIVHFNYSPSEKKLKIVLISCICKIEIGMELWNYKGKQDSITEALQIRLPEHAVISVTGAGGKTSLIFAWAKELAEAGKKVVITTTTHMYRPALPDSENIRIVVSDDPECADKVIAPPKDILDSLRDKADVVLIEADGSRRKPLKWPADWEPVVPDYSDFTVCVAGLSAVGQKTEDAVFRAEHLPEAIKRDIVDVNLIHKILASRSGGQKGVRGDFRVFLNQVDDDTDRLAAAYRLQQILGVFGIQTAWGSLRGHISSQNSLPARRPTSNFAACAREGSKIAVILEAAGDSKRFGGNKLLHTMEDGRPMIASILDTVRRIDAYKRIIVTQYDEVAALASDFEVVRNDRPDLGISRSMQLGIEAAKGADAYMFCVCDQPGLKPATLERLMDAYKKGTAGIVSLSWQGKMCNPKIFSSAYRDELMALSGDTGGRQIISEHKKDLLLVEADSEDEVMDIDSL